MCLGVQPSYEQFFFFTSDWTILGGITVTEGGSRVMKKILRAVGRQASSTP